uniref:Ig-like domain-containing protein n=1 Tax=Leptobrachium leishanense TaxID=445787 RepID=A0A8C5PR11_9ANUR
GVSATGGVLMIVSFTSPSVTEMVRSWKGLYHDVGVGKERDRSASVIRITSSTTSSLVKLAIPNLALNYCLMISFFNAPPEVKVTGRHVDINEESVLSCLITGFYPADIDIKWLKDGEILDHVSENRPQRNPNGTYSVTTSLFLSLNDWADPAHSRERVHQKYMYNLLAECCIWRFL